MAWLAGASGTALLVVLVRWLRGTWDVIGPKPSRPWFSGSALALLTAVSGTVAVRHHLRDNRLSAVASTLAGRPVRVRCQSDVSSFFDGTLEPGTVAFQPNGKLETKTTLSTEVCGSLASYLGSPHGSPTGAQVVAVHVLTHEAMHMAGLADEAEAECAAVQRDAMTARLMGATPAEASALATTYWQEWHPRLPSGYRSGGCVPGGPLDEALRDGPWGDAPAGVVVHPPPEP